MKTTTLKLAVMAALAVCACAAHGAHAQARKARAETPAPRFEDYPARGVYRGPIARVRLDSKMARMFRTRLREGSRTGPNFAGHYTVVIWGCGTGCAQMGVADARTGRVYFPPLEYMDIPDMETAESHARDFRLGSRLLVLTQNHYDGRGGYAAFYYLFDNNRFRLLRKAEEHWPQPEETEDEN
jgi:hypothetical protein